MKHFNQTLHKTEKWDSLFFFFLSFLFFFYLYIWSKMLHFFIKFIKTNLLNINQKILLHWLAFFYNILVHKKYNTNSMSCIAHWRYYFTTAHTFFFFFKFCHGIHYYENKHVDSIYDRMCERKIFLLKI